VPYRGFGKFKNMAIRPSAHAFKHSGIRGFFSHIFGRYLGEPHLRISASSIHFKNAGLTGTVNEFDFLKTLMSDIRPELIKEALVFAESLPELKISQESEGVFPNNWNSGPSLQKIMAALIWVLKPELVVETGTANGASALAISSAMNAINAGRLVSIDINDCPATLVPLHLRRYIKFVKINGSTKDLRRILKSETLNVNTSIFLHDGDHSYLGQLSDYATAREFNFDIIISDDVDASMAFIDFVAPKGAVFYTSNKFIGGILETRILQK
jgi:hypothetical protein